MQRQGREGEERKNRMRRRPSAPSGSRTPGTPTKRTPTSSAQRGASSAYDQMAHSLFKTDTGYVRRNFAGVWQILREYGHLGFFSFFRRDGLWKKKREKNGHLGFKTIKTTVHDEVSHDGAERLCEVDLRGKASTCPLARLFW